MSFFPHTLITHDPTPSTFHPLFRLLDDFDQYTRSSTGSPSAVTQRGDNHGGRGGALTQQLRTFTPRFDVQEHDNVYELHGELPGIEQKDVEIEFVDDQTLTIRGRTERSFSSGGEGNEAAGENGQGSHRATVEDADDADAHGRKGKQQQQQQQQVAKVDSKEVTKHQQQRQPKYWVSERSVGEFSRSFTFPVRVDQDNVSASMKNGVLNIVVPKAKKVEGRKINIS